jgi:hypothetical protein
MTVVSVVLALVQLTGPDGKQRVDINPSEVTSIREPQGVDKGHWAKGTNCLVVMADGKFITTSEECAVVRRRLGEADRRTP